MTARCAVAELRNSRDCFKESTRPHILGVFPCKPCQILLFRPNRGKSLFALADYAHKELSALERNIDAEQHLQVDVSQPECALPGEVMSSGWAAARVGSEGGTRGWTAALVRCPGALPKCLQGHGHREARAGQYIACRGQLEVPVWQNHQVLLLLCFTTKLLSKTHLRQPRQPREKRQEGSSLWLLV